MLTGLRQRMLLSGRAIRVVCLVAVGGALAACSATERPAPKFSEAEYGKSSPRVAGGGKKIPDGGGRHMVGEPYRIAGKRYVPKANPDGYSATGYASWYGSNFHGRKTANGEVYDMTDLSAAHPTLPLPSYARVTNLNNGRSVVVRVNDRGPFTHNRIIDVSSQTASMLDFKRSGTAKVKVEYIGPAQLDGKDDAMLMASYRGPGSSAPTTMVASADIRPTRPALVALGPKSRPAIDFSVADDSMAFGATPASATFSDPIAPLILQTGFASSYAAPEPYRFTRAQAAATAMANGGEVTAPKPVSALPAPRTVQVGTFSDVSNAKRAATRLSRLGEPVIAEDTRAGKTVHVVRIRVVDASVDAAAVIDAADGIGLPGAFVVSPSK